MRHGWWERRGSVRKVAKNLGWREVSRDSWAAQQGLERVGGGGVLVSLGCFALLLALLAKRQTVGRRHFTRSASYRAEWDGLFDRQNFKGFVLCSRLQSCVAKRKCLMQAYQTSH